MTVANHTRTRPADILYHNRVCSFHSGACFLLWYSNSREITSIGIQALRKYEILTFAKIQSRLGIPVYGQAQEFSNRQAALYIVENHLQIFVRAAYRSLIVDQ